MHSPHFVELSAYFNALLLGAAVRERQQIGGMGGCIFGCGLYKFYFCLAASQKCTLFNGHGLCASQLGATQAGGHKSRRGFKFPPARKNLSTQRASGHAGAQSALNCAARRHKLFKYIPRGKRG